MKVNVRDAKTRLSELLSRVEGGDEIIITRAGRPVATRDADIAKYKVKIVW